MGMGLEDWERRLAWWFSREAADEVVLRMFWRPVAVDDEKMSMRADMFWSVGLCLVACFRGLLKAYIYI